ncbi:MAG: glycosyl hydrolase [Deltaproteobacteria bacterium]|nr:glycosyl hydrolase [Deltaproteobacteria bacterium]
MPRLTLFIALSILAACNKDPDDDAHLYHTEDKAPDLSWDAIEAMDHMGPTLTEKGVNFCVWSEKATRIELLLFEDPEAELPTKRFPMTQTGDLWNLYVEGVGVGQHYAFAAWGPNWVYDEAWLPGRIDGFLTDVDDAGNRFDPNKALIDPWAKAIHRDHDWGKGSTATGPARTQSTWSASSKSIVIRTDTYAWSEAEAGWQAMRTDPSAEGHGWDDLILYEVHPKGFTMNAASGVDHPGTYRGIGEKAAYLQDLGITAVELLPIHEKPLDGGYWGYNTLNFFAPEMQYSSAWNDRREPDEVIDEFKWMVDQLHQHDIEVILDVVYNHTGEGGFWREKLYFNDTDLDPTTSAESYNLDPKEVVGLYSFRGFDNAGWYALTEDNQSYWGNTGVGNQTRPNYTPMERLVQDSIHFYVEEMHVDGFRFDLAGILGEIDGDFNNWDGEDSLLKTLAEDPLLHERNVRLIAEPWTAGGWYGPLIGAYPASDTLPGYGWMEWNARFRDWWRAFINEDHWNLSSQEAGADGGFVMTGCSSYYDWNGRGPASSVNFITAHDGFTLYDLFSYNQKQNGCGVLNPVCCDDPTSAWCQADTGDSNNRSRDWGMENEHLKRQMMRNAFAAMLFSHGTPMLLGGDEWMRTQYGNNNAYSTWSDNEWNWFRWGEWTATTAEERHRMHDFVRQMIHFRLAHTYALAPEGWGTGMPLAWKSPANGDSPNWGGKQLMLHYYDPDGSWDQPELVIAINMDAGGTADFTLPGGRTWARVMDTQSWYDTDGYFTESPGADVYQSQNFWTEDRIVVEGGETYGLPYRSIAIFEEVQD